MGGRAAHTAREPRLRWAGGQCRGCWARRSADSTASLRDGRGAGRRPAQVRGRGKETMIDTTLRSFIVLAVASIASALGVILFRNAVHSALSRILTLLFLAVFYLQLGAMFIASVLILIYAGAI